MSNGNSLILIADDNESSRYTKARILRGADFEVIEAANGHDALRLTTECQPRMVILDVHMPGIDGWEVCRRLKSEAATASVLVLQISATYVTEQDTVRALEGGADGCLTEPVEAPVLIATVRALLRARQAEDAMRVALASEQQARALAESANRTKDEFLATLSHELRSPLSAILTWVTLLQSGKVDESRLRQGLEVIERNTRQQSQLIEDLLDISRIISGKMRIEMTSIDLGGVVNAAVTAVRPSAEAKRIRLDAIIDQLVPVLAGDPSRVQQIVANLLSNAVKFTPAGGSVHVSVTKDRDMAQVKVSDTGRGIEPGFLPHIFERFRQADSTSTRAEGGLGLGLALVRHLAELHGGTVTAHSAGVGQGATFVVRLPLPSVREIHLGATETKPTVSRPMSLSDLRVLVLDDNDDAREALAQALTLAGATVVAAATVAAALRAVDEGTVDVVLSDIAMPDEDGYAFIQQLRARAGGGTRLPVLALTAYAGGDEQRRAMDAGFDRYFTKPVDFPALTHALRTLVRRDA